MCVSFTGITFFSNLKNSYLGITEAGKLGGSELCELQQKDSILESLSPISCHVHVKRMSNINALHIFMNFKKNCQKPAFGPFFPSFFKSVIVHSNRFIEIRRCEKKFEPSGGKKNNSHRPVADIPSMKVVMLEVALRQKLMQPLVR